MKASIYFHQPVSSITKLLVGVKEIIVEAQTKYQHVLIARLHEYGLSLVLDDLIQVAQADEAIYHESLVHPALLLHGHPKKVLIIGGGDGCALREVLKYKVDSVSLVDIDGELVELCKRYLGEINLNSLKDPRAKLLIMDGKEFVEKTKDRYDCIIIDLTDPFGPEISKELYSEKFYSKINEILNEEGIVVTQAGSAFYYEEVFNEVFSNISSVFKNVKSYEVWVPSFGYSCCFILASNTLDIERLSIEEIKKRIEENNLNLKFYNPNFHEALMKKPLTRNVFKVG